MSSFDKRGFGFTIKFFGGICLLYFCVSFSANFFFGSVFAVYEPVPIAARENLALAVGAGALSKEESREVVLGFVGDIMLDRGVEKAVQSHAGGDFRSVFKLVEGELSGLDLLFGNLEGPVSDKGRDLGSLYSFRMAPEVIDVLASAGFDILSLANNHAGDWGEEALFDTLRRLEAAGLGAVGAGFSPAEAYAPFTAEIEGFKIAIFSFTESPGIYKGRNVALAREPEIRKNLEEFAVSESADLVVVHFHFGDEYVREPNEKQKRLARLAIDSGADLVIGSHPHVTQTLEKYAAGFIVYSLGNFVFDQYFSDETMRGWLLKVRVIGREVAGLEICDVHIHSLFRPTILHCYPVEEL